MGALKAWFHKITRNTFIFVRSVIKSFDFNFLSKNLFELGTKMKVLGLFVSDSELIFQNKYREILRQIR